MKYEDVVFKVAHFLVKPCISVNKLFTIKTIGLPHASGYIIMMQKFCIINH